MRLRRLTIALFIASFVLASAGPIDDARKLFKEGEYQQVVEKMRPVVKKSPKDGNATYFLGASLYALGDRDECIAPLKVAESRGVTDASRILAEIASDNYDVDAAEEHLQTWEAKLRKSKKDTPEEYDEISSRIVRLRNMLERVERIEILDTINVDERDFFRHYRLSKAAGKILAPDAVRHLGAADDSAELSLAYLPENNSEILWAQADSAGVFSLYGADILDDGHVDHTAILDETLGEGGNAAFPFLMSDGMTLYFANDGSNSLGGYDIFMTRRSDSDSGERSYFQPQNLGMPYNSPFNDYMMAVDETSGLGWFASDREQIPGKVTIYIFAPSQMRVNVEPDDPDIASMALLRDISLFQKEGVDYKSMLAQRLPSDSNDEVLETSGPSFVIDGGNGKIYYRVSDFSNARARSAMLEAMAAESALRRHIDQENALREEYRKGNKNVSDRILESEKETVRLRKQLLNLRNRAIKLENN